MRGSPACVAIRARRGPRPRRSAGTSAMACGRSARSPTGRRPRCGPTSWPTTCPTTRCTTAGTSRSAARTAPAPRPAATAVGRAPTRSSAGCTASRAVEPPGGACRPAGDRICAMDPLIVLFGLGVGLLVGTTGVGGGSVMTPVLILAFGIKPVLAVGTDLAYGAITKTVGGWQHLRQGTVSMRIALWLAVGSIPGALGGVVLLDRLHAAYGDDIDSVVMAMVAGAVLLTAGLMFGRSLFMPKLVERERDQVDPFKLKHKLAAVAIGLSVGFVLGVTSVGSGALIAVGLILIYRL